jgi:cholest-4-en-3-one 26-monooxygenase
LFTPRSVAALEHKLAVAAREIVAAAKERNSGNFVDEVAMPLPLLAIADLIGVPEEDREKIFHWSNCIMNTDDPDFDADPTTANAELMGYAYTMAEARRKCPADDIVTRLVQADLGDEAGGGITDVEFAFFVILLAVAGNETTRNAMTHGMNAFFENPDQWELFHRGDHPLGHTGALFPAHRTRRHRDRRGDHPQGPARRAVLQLGQL